MKLKKILLWTTCIIILFSLPFIIKSTWFEFDKDIDGNRFSQYGSYIGGLLGATFAGLSFFILALTFKHQIDISEATKKNEQLNYIHILYDSVLSEINNLSYKNIRGTEVFYSFTMESINEPQGVLDQLNSLLSSFENLISFSKTFTFPNEETRKITMTRIYFLYYSKIIWPVHANIWTKMKDRLQAEHDDAEFYFIKYQNLSIEAIEYLSNQNLIAGGKEHFNYKNPL